MEAGVLELMAVAEGARHAAARPRNLGPQKARRDREERKAGRLASAGSRGPRVGGRALGNPAKRSMGRRAVMVRWRGEGKSALWFRTTKEQGEWAELCFMARARQIGMTVLKPWGDSQQYDVGIDRRGRLLRVQVKSSTFVRGGSYTCNLFGSGHTMYVECDVDYFAVYLVQVDRWYIMPWKAVSDGGGSVKLRPGSDHKFEQYLEGWNLLR